LVLLEGPSTLDEGKIFALSLPQMAEVLDARVLLVARPYSSLFLDGLLSAKERLGQRLLGLVINDTSPTDYETVSDSYQPFLEASGLKVLGILPRSALLRSVSVDELVKQLHAEVICRRDRLDLMVETLTVGAMSVNAALKYFRQGTNMAVITGGDRADLQLAALEASTHCLILTGQIRPEPLVISRAEELEVPILSVASDTLTTVEVVDRTFGKVRLHEPIKVECISQLMAEHFHFDSLLALMGLG
jgi:BioD-like phosphotransacetylase family protein